MKSIGFIGKTDKQDIVLYLSKMIASMGKKVIVIDATINQKARYTIPYIDMDEIPAQYITERDGIDVAVGFSNILELKKYLLSKGEDFVDYEYVLIDTDIEEMCDEYDLKNANNIFFVTTFDKMHLAKGTDLLKYLCATKRKENPTGEIDIIKVMMYTQVSSADINYVNRLTENLPIIWNKEAITLSYDEGDLSVGIQNQYSNKVSFKYLSQQTKEGIVNIASIVTNEDKNKLKKIAKFIEKGKSF